MFVFVQVIDIGLVETLSSNDLNEVLRKALPLLNPIQVFFYTCSVYVTILLTVVRYIAVCHHNKTHLITRKKIKAYIGIVMFFSLIWNVPRFFAYEGQHGCLTTFGKSESYTTFYLTGGKVTVQFIIPLAVLFVLNLCMLRKVILFHFLSLAQFLTSVSSFLLPNFIPREHSQNFSLIIRAKVFQFRSMLLLVFDWNLATIF